MDPVINLNKWKMIFQRKELRVIMPLHPTKGECYIEPVHDFVEYDDDLN